MCFQKKFNADKHLNNVHNNAIDDAKKSVRSGGILSLTTKQIL